MTAANPRLQRLPCERLLPLADCSRRLVTAATATRAATPLRTRLSCWQLARYQSGARRSTTVSATTAVTARTLTMRWTQTRTMMMTMIALSQETSHASSAIACCGSGCAIALLRSSSARHHRPRQDRSGGEFSSREPLMKTSLKTRSLVCGAFCASDQTKLLLSHHRRRRSQRRRRAQRHHFVPATVAVVAAAADLLHRLPAPLLPPPRGSDESRRRPPAATPRARASECPPSSRCQPAVKPQRETSKLCTEAKSRCIANLGAARIFLDEASTLRTRASIHRENADEGSHHVAKSLENPELARHQVLVFENAISDLIHKRSSQQ